MNGKLTLEYTADGKEYELTGMVKDVELREWPEQEEKIELDTRTIYSWDTPKRNYFTFIPEDNGVYLRIKANELNFKQKKQNALLKIVELSKQLEETDIDRRILENQLTAARAVWDKLKEEK